MQSRCTITGIRRVVAPVVVGVLTSVLVATTSAAPTPEQRREIAALRKSILDAGLLYKDRQFAESAEKVREVQERTEQMVQEADAATFLLMKPLFESLKKAHALLELEGVELTPLDLPDRPIAKPKEPDKPVTPDTPEPVEGGTSFVKEVTPILIAKCGRCHVQRSSGELSMATYASLMKGSKAGVVIFPRDADGSEMIMAIVEGDMPRGGLRINAPELATLKKWITEGAAFDGESPEANITTLAGGATPTATATPTPPPTPEVVQATGKETVSFAQQIAPVLVENCSGCHGMNNPRNNLSMLTFARLLRGGDSGSPVVPGNGAESLIVQKLKGTAGGQRMPAGRDPLADDTIALVETWINEGATFDGPDAAMNLSQVAALARANAATHEELMAERVTKAGENWRLAMPRITARSAETEHFLLMGNVGDNALAEVSEKAESVVPKIATLFKAPSDQPLIKGRMTLFVFQQRYDYSEFGQMVERRDLPREWRGHWQYDVIDAYGAMVAPRDDEFGVEALVAQQLAGAYIASLGTLPPRWFSEGSARVAASRIDSRDARVMEWDNTLSQALASMSRPDDFLTGKLAPEFADIAAYSFVGYLMGESRRYSSLLKSLREGEAFDMAFSSAYGGTPAQVADVWYRRTARRASGN